MATAPNAVGREGIEPPQPKAADLQIDARATPFAARNLRFSEQTRELILGKVRGVRRPTKSGTKERPLPSPAEKALFPESRAVEIFEHAN